MEYRVTNLDKKEHATITASDVASAVRTFWHEPVLFMGAHVACDNCFRGSAYANDGHVLGRMEIVRVA